MSSMSIPKEMSAWRVNAYGEGGNPKDAIDKMTLDRVPVPEPGEGSVLIRVDMTSVNPVDWKLYTGGMHGMCPMKFPCVAGFDVAGVVVKLGPGVSALAVGDKVCANIGVAESCTKEPKHDTGGGCGEYAVADASTVSKREGLAASEVAGLPLAGQTSYQALVTGAASDMQGGDLGELKAGEKVLVLGGAGGTGSLAIQIAKSLGAHVATTASENKLPDGMTKVDFVKQMGADEVIDYKKADWSDVLAGQGYDLIFDCAGDAADLAKASKVLKKKASFVSIANFNGSSTPEVKFKAFFCRSATGDLDKLVALMKEGKMRVPIDATFPFDKVPEAFALSLAGRGAGKICMRVRGGSKAGVKALVTGGSGFLGAWCVKILLDRGYTVHTTVRSEEKAAFLKELPGAAERLKIFGGVDLLAPGSYDAAMEGCELVLQTASPFFFDFSADVGEDKLVKPAVDGIRNVLGSCTKLGVKKVVVTSSVGTVYNPGGPRKPSYSADDWSDEALMRAQRDWYHLSKTIQERTAWELSRESGCPWKMAVMNPNLIYGPMVPGQPALNTSSMFLLTHFDGSMAKCSDSFQGVVDVRDVAEAHVAALDIDEAFGHRFLQVGDVPHGERMAELVRQSVPEDLKAKVPTEVDKAAEPPIDHVFDCSPSLQIMDVRYRKAAEMVKDSVQQLLANGFTSASQYVPGK